MAMCSLAHAKCAKGKSLSLPNYFLMFERNSGFDECFLCDIMWNSDAFESSTFRFILLFLFHKSLFSLKVHVFEGECDFMFTGNADEAIDLYKNALHVIKDSDYMSLDDSLMENMRIDLAELLHTVGR